MTEELVGRLNSYWEKQLSSMLWSFQSPTLMDISSLRVDTVTGEVYVERK